MTGASVEVSDLTEGAVEVRWSPPTDADTLEAFPGPYRYVVEARPAVGEGLGDDRRDSHFGGLGRFGYSRGAQRDQQRVAPLGIPGFRLGVEKI